MYFCFGVGLGKGALLQIAHDCSGTRVQVVFIAVVAFDFAHDTAQSVVDLQPLLGAT